jgi:hypothetical protein
MALTDEDKQWISGELERVETRLLRTFHDWAAPVDMRLRAHSAALRALDVEQETLVNRVTEIERSKRPPAA